MKNRVLLKNCYLPGDLKAQISAFIEHYNHRRSRKSLNNLTPADVYFGRGHAIRLERERNHPAAPIDPPLESSIGSTSQMSQGLR